MRETSHGAARRRLAEQRAAGVLPRIDDAKVRDRFMSRVTRNPNNGCWEWQGSRDVQRGQLMYGRICVDGITQHAHRIAYRLFTGGIPVALNVLHTCDNYACVNPEHLYLGTFADNSRDAKERGRLATGMRSGAYTHPEKVPRGDNHSSKLHPERVARGERVTSHKLTAADVLEIRALYAGGVGPTALSKRFGVSKSSVLRAAIRETWQHV